MNRFLVLSSIFLSLLHWSECVNSTWVYIGDMPSPQMHYANTLFVLNNDIYFYGKPWNTWITFLWKFTPATNNWNLVSGNASIPRWFQDGIVYQTPNGPNMFIYGGVENAGFGPDGLPSPNWVTNMLVYNSNSNTFDSIATNGSLKLQSPSLTYDSENNSVLLFGGCYNNPNMNKTFRFTFGDKTWREINVNLDIPSANTTNNSTRPAFITGRCGHTAVRLGTQRKILIFGGHSGGEFLGDIWIFDMDNQTWTYTIPQGDAKPAGRCYHAAVALDNIVILFGGDWTGIRHLNDMWAYSLDYNRWILLSPDGGWTPSEVKPMRRAHHSMVASGDKLYVFGGQTHTPSGENMFLSDLWTYQLGCQNNCSGNGICDKIVCICNNCTAGSDCSIKTCTDTNPPTAVETVPVTAKKVVLTVVWAVIAAIGFVIIASIITSVIIYQRFKKWKAQKLAKEKGDSEMQSKERISIDLRKEEAAK